ncbi:MAG TPA: C45 family autoproteolytic acyltransferase/hydrolase, partial [Gemmataceae bacterium]|nr:C45 family autoproteolytic acyltransferase/hydrolase [Gemmataceae bacterium]
MLKALVNGFGPAAEARDMVDVVLARMELPSFAEFAWNDAERLGADVWITQLALLAADTIVNAAVRSLGLTPERVGGHSFGELVALAAADAWTFEDAVRATSARCASIESCQNAKGALLSTTAPATVADKFCAEVCGTEIGSRVYVSHRNAPDQSVVGGDPAAVTLVGEMLAAAGYRTKLLDVPAAFHTPLMEEVKGPFGAALESIPLEPPKIPLLSSVTNRYVSDPAEVRDNLVVQMTQPVYWIELIERLYREGFNVLVEVGPKQVLTGLHKQILAGKEAALVGADHPKRDGIQQLLFVRACVEVSGALDAAARGVAGPSIPAPIKAEPAPARVAPAPVASTPIASNAHFESIEQIGTARVLRLGGTPYEMGLQHGRAEGENIRRVLRRYADLAGTRWDLTPQIEAAAANPSAWFGAEELEELRGIAKGANVAPEALIAHNLRMFYDVGAGGLHFAVRNGAGDDILHGGNEDLQPALCLRDCLERHVQVRTPGTGHSHIAFCVVGQVGTLNGINAAGLAISTSALVDAPRGDVAAQWLHTVLVKRVLEQAADIDSAIPLIRTHRSAGAWTACLSHHPSNRLCYVEFDGRELKVTPSTDQVLAANHRQLKTFAAAEKSLNGGVPAHSKNRMDRMRRLLGGEFGSVSPESARAALRDRFDTSRGRDSEYPTLNTVRRVDNQISFVVHAAKDELWITAGPLANGHANDFECLKL